LPLFCILISSFWNSNVSPVLTCGEWIHKHSYVK
jgi:hypothetical protein